jgi:hypothetical protein
MCRVFWLVGDRHRLSHRTLLVAGGEYAGKVVPHARFRRSKACRRISVRPSAKPTLVRTQHLPPPAKTARELGYSWLGGSSCLVSSCVIVGQQASPRGDGYGHMADANPAGASAVAVLVWSRWSWSADLADRCPDRDPPRLCPRPGPLPTGLSVRADQEGPLVIIASRRPTLAPTTLSPTTRCARFLPSRSAAGGANDRPPVEDPFAAALAAVDGLTSGRRTAQQSG